MKIIMGLLKQYTVQIVITSILLFADALITLNIPQCMSEIVDKGIQQSDLAYVFFMGKRMVVLSVISMICILFASYLAIRIVISFTCDLKEAIFCRVMRWGQKEYEQFTAASLITRTNSDVEKVYLALDFLIQGLVSSLVFAVGGIIKSVTRAKSLSWIIIATIPLVVGVAVFVLLYTLPNVQKLKTTMDRINLLSRENMRGIRVIKAFGKEEYQQKKYDACNRQLYLLSKQVQKINAISFPFIILVLNMAMLLVVWVGAKAVADNLATVGNIMEYIQYVNLVVSGFMILATASSTIPDVIVSLRRISEIFQVEIQTTERIKNDVRNGKENKMKGVQFKNVSYRYDSSSEDVIRNVSFLAKPGEITAIIGSTGCGKTTLMNLIPGLYDIGSGEVSVNGIPVSEWNPKELRQRIAFVTQDTRLLSGTLEENLKAGKEQIDQFSMKKALEDAQLADWIEGQTEPYQMFITREGMNLSGGQKQRVSIARALVQNTDILILDDSLSALDTKTSYQLRCRLQEQKKDKVILMVSQRIDTIMDAEQIIVLDNGEIAGKGTHETLLKNCKVYQELAASQLQEVG